MPGNTAVKTSRRAPSKKTKHILNCLPSPGREKDWSFGSAQAAGLVGAPPALPSSVDLRDDTWWHVGNQGSTGSCVGWASADSVLRWHFVKAGRLDKTKKLSVRYIWMAAKETDEFLLRPTSFIECDGTSLKAALDVARKFGVVTEDDLPFAGGRLYQGEASAFYSLASTRRIASYYSLRLPITTQDLLVYSFRTWLARKGPILVRLTVDQTFNSLSADPTGRLETYVPYPPGVSGGHAVALVGYTPTSFIVRNSWGEDWGDCGYGYASLKYAVSAFEEAYGVIV